MSRIGAVLLIVVSAALCQAHVGSPDVFFEGKAGPYPLLIAIRPPAAIPGVAAVEIRSLSLGVSRLRILPMPLTGPGAKYPPTADVAERSKDDPQFFTGNLWIMDFGSWQVRVMAEGESGAGQLSVPMPAIASKNTSMQRPLGIALFGMMAFLVVGLVSIVGAGFREAQLEPGLDSPPARRRRSFIVMGATSLGLIALLYWGNQWWGSEASAYSRKLYKPLAMAASLNAGNHMDLRLTDPGWLRFRKLDDLIPDHNHLMHLFVVSMPAMDRMWHLHPDQLEAGDFALDLPTMPRGRYRLFADVVHGNGLAETAVTELDLPAMVGKPLAGDDAEGSGVPAGTSFTLPDGYKMVRLGPALPVKVKRMNLFEFRLDDPAGQPAGDMQLYMGMPGHAEFIRSDASVFAHVHPSGSVSMAALGIAQPSQAMPAMHSMAGMDDVKIPATVSFPYGLPEPGKYRVFVQMKHGGRVETGMFDIEAVP